MIQTKLINKDKIYKIYNGIIYITLHIDYTLKKFKILTDRGDEEFIFKNLLVSKNVIDLLREAYLIINEELGELKK